MNAVKMAYAKTPDGAVVHVDSAKNGLACGCHCIECGEPVVARQGQVNKWHFSHSYESPCLGYTKETVIHYRAKHLIADAIKIGGVHSILPRSLFNVTIAGESETKAYIFFNIVNGKRQEKKLSEPQDYRILVSNISGDGSPPSGVGFYSSDRVNILRRMIPDTECEVEVEGVSPCKRYRPDVSVYPSGEAKQEGPRIAFVGFEVVASHDIDDGKLRKIRDANDISFRIVLRDVSPRISDADLLELIKSSIQVASYGEGHWEEQMREMYSFAKRDVVYGLSEREQKVASDLIHKWFGQAVDLSFRSRSVRGESFFCDLIWHKQNEGKTHED